MGVLGNLVLYLRGEAERLLYEVETNFKLLNASNILTKKSDATAGLNELYAGLIKSIRLLRKSKVPPKVIAELQIDAAKIKGLRNKVKKVTPQNLERLRALLLNEVNSAKDTLRLVEHGLVELARNEN